MRQQVFNCFFLLTVSALPAALLQEAVEEVFPPFAIGCYEEDLSEIADRDRDIPTFYDRNKWELMRQRDRWLLRHGKCFPPPDVIVSPGITLPPRRNGEFSEYDPRNSRYRSAR